MFKELGDDMSADEIKERMRLLEDIVSFSMKEATKRILDISKNVDLGPRKRVTVLIKASATIFTGALCVAMDDGMPKDMALRTLQIFEKRVREYEPGSPDKETAH